MSVIVEKPYVFIPPKPGDFWPSFIQRFHIYDFYLRHKEGVVSYECRHIDRLRDSIKRGDGILLAPNHCRYADPLVLGWLSREAGRHVFAMASWHLFNKSRLDRFAIPRMGGFSIFREGLDRQSLETAITALTEAKRPLVVFPEGTTNRINDALQPLLDGVLFMARTAARRRAKQPQGGQVVIHPVGIKYLFRGDIQEWGDRALQILEKRLSWHVPTSMGLLERLSRVSEGLLALKEIQYLGRSQGGDIVERRNSLIEHLLAPLEQIYLGTVAVEKERVLNRVRACRSKICGLLLNESTTPQQRQLLRQHGRDIELAQQLHSYPANYLAGESVTDTRVLETLERMHEDFMGKAILPKPLHAVIEVDESLPVTDERVPRGESDPLLNQLTIRLTAMLQRLSLEANPLGKINERSSLTKSLQADH